MVYSTEASKWRAYQFSDPFAAGSFVVCNKINTKFCRPDCDTHPITELRAEIKFVDSAADAVKLGYSPCESCNPTVVPSININLLLKTVKDINASIGFVQPLLDDDEDKVHETIKENIICHGHDQRRMSLPANAYTKNNKNVQYSVSKNDSEHYRLIDLACRHLALAAANSIFSAPSSASTPSSGASSPKEESAPKKKGVRKRRGGVLGFKELATKSKLSAWHFHRVFKSIIGLTPKTYGDMCWEYLENERDNSNTCNSPFLKPEVSAGSEVGARRGSLASSCVKLEKTGKKASAGQKRSADSVKDELDVPEPKRANTAVLDEVKVKEEEKDFDLGSRATSEPNLAAIYGSGAPRSLFQHLANFNSINDQSSNHQDQPRQYADQTQQYADQAQQYSEQAQQFSDYSEHTPSPRHEAGFEFSSDYVQPQYPMAQVAPQMTMAQNDFQLSFGLDDDFSSVNISPVTMTNETPQDMDRLGMGYDDPMSMYLSPQNDMGPLDHYMAPDAVPELPVYDDKKALDLGADPMMAGINDMLVASGY